MEYYLAIDIGASSGRHIVGYEENGRVVTDEVYRFPNFVTESTEGLTWDVSRLFSEVKTGIARAFEKYPKIESLSIDTWGVDYVLLRGDEEVLPVFAYRDSRTEAVIPEVHSIISESELYSRTGIGFMAFNSIYQLYSDKKAGRLEGVTDMLMLPEYLMYKLTGERRRERTDATTSGLVNCESLEYDPEIFERLGLPSILIRPLNAPGESVGRLLPEVAREVGGDTEVVLCATHDTASAVEGIPMKKNSLYISSGTWSLLGLKTERAINDEASRLSAYSNEGGVGYNRYQKNITGMWLIQNLRAELCPSLDFSEVTDLALTSDYCGVFDVNSPKLTAPESMKAAIAACLGTDADALSDADAFNSAYLSIAKEYARAIADLERNVKKKYTEVYIVGGGAKNDYLNSLTEEITGKRVVALPIEATTLGNLKVQMSRRVK